MAVTATVVQSDNPLTSHDCFLPFKFWA